MCGDGSDPRKPRRSSPHPSNFRTHSSDACRAHQRIYVLERLAFHSFAKIDRQKCFKYTVDCFLGQQVLSLLRARGPSQATTCASQCTTLCRSSPEPGTQGRRSRRRPSRCLGLKVELCRDCVAFGWLCQWAAHRDVHCAAEHAHRECSGSPSLLACCSAPTFLQLDPCFTHATLLAGHLPCRLSHAPASVSAPHCCPAGTVKPCTTLPNSDACSKGAQRRGR